MSPAVQLLLRGSLVEEMLTKCECRPVVKDGSGHFGFKLISAVFPGGDMYSQFIKKRMRL
jgi:hypothetical protein